MGALASLLQDLGWKVTGSDGPLYPPMSTFLESRKIPVKGYDAANLAGAAWGLPAPKPDLVIVGNAISRTHAEAQAVEKLVEAGTVRMSFAQALAEFCIGDKRSFVVAGTHGKTTTTSVMAWAFESLGLSPGFFVGGIPKNFGQGCRVGEGRVFVSEGDEYDTAYWDKESKFLHYRPSWVLCTSIEFDHADIYASLEAVEASFLKLVDKTREGWILIDGPSSPSPASVDKVAAKLKAKGLPCLRYGRDASSAYRLLSCEAEPLPWDTSVRGTRVRLSTPELGEIALDSPMIGEHNALNLVGVVGSLLASKSVKTVAQLQDFLKTFAGVKRRQEEVFVSPALVVIDDFAHHPTAIRETLFAIRSRYPGASVGAFFEPRSATSARNVLAQGFSECFDGADAVFLVPPTKTNVPEAERLDVNDVLKKAGARPGNAGKLYVADSSVEKIAESFRSWRRAQAGRRAVALVMSNGPFGGLHGMLSRD
jgi:UDP-N-acetylmuramate: L-alanyl-gamma-D-glutamyl-meso-diaminopimelate ligase